MSTYDREIPPPVPPRDRDPAVSHHGATAGTAGMNGATAIATNGAAGTTGTTNANGTTNPHPTKLSTLRSAFHGMHGAGDLIRGTFNQAIETALHNKEDAARHKAIARRGLEEIRVARGHGTAASTAGTTSPGTTAGANGAENTVDTNHGPRTAGPGEKVDPSVNGGLGGAGFSGATDTGLTSCGAAGAGDERLASTSHGRHADVKPDPRVDSDLDRRVNPGVTGGGGAATTNAGPNGYAETTNNGPRTSNFASKLEHRVGGPAYATNTNTDANTDTLSGNDPHASNFANKLTHPVDSDVDHRAVNGTRPGDAGANENPTSARGPRATDAGDKLDPRVGGDMDNRANPGVNGYVENSVSTDGGPHASNVGNKLDPRVESDVDGRPNTQTN